MNESTFHWLQLIGILITVIFGPWIREKLNLAKLQGNEEAQSKYSNELVRAIESKINAHILACDQIPKTLILEKISNLSRLIEESEDRQKEIFDRIENDIRYGRDRTDKVLEFLNRTFNSGPVGLKP